jgi:Plasmid pRiA4b ORF-3-like protein
MPAKKGKQPDAKLRLKLTVDERESLSHAIRLPPELKTRIEETPADQKFLEFTKGELEKLEDQIDNSLRHAPDAHWKRLNTVLCKVGGLLADLDEKELKEKRRALSKSGSIYQLKITIKGCNPPVWRRIQVPDCSLGELHEILQVVMGWENSHLHQFDVHGECYGPLDDKGADWDEGIMDEEKISISQIAESVRRVRFSYTYDFGDDWQHDVLLERTLDPGPRVAYPRCTAGARACPPEEVGGICGYPEFLAAMADPKHPDHSQMKEWIGGKFDAESFRVDKANSELEKRH